MNPLAGMSDTARHMVTGAVLICVLIVVGLSLAWCGKQGEAARARFDRNVAGAQAGQGEKAATITAGQVQAEADNAAQTGRNREDILDAENANDSAGDAGDRGLRALCDRVRYRDSVRCVELRRADRANASN